MNKSNLSPGLYIISTPIGNLKDITLRAIDTIASLHLLLCEDTRVSKKLLHAHHLKTPSLLSFHAHNQKQIIPRVIDSLENNLAVGLISDAGTPLVSDPGFELVCAAKKRNIPVISIPGPSAVLAALTASGLPTTPFTFAGFPPRTQKKQADFFAQFLPLAHTIIFFEAPHRIATSLNSMYQIFPHNSNIVIARELSKKFEQYIHGQLEELSFASSPLASFPKKGECVILIAPRTSTATTTTSLNDQQVLTLLKKALPKKPSPSETKAVIQALHVATGVPKKVIYSLNLSLKASD